MKKLFFLFAVIVALFIASGQSYEQQTIVPQLEEWLPNQPLESLLSKLEIPYWGRIISVEERGYYYFIEFLLRKATHFFFFGLLAIVVYVVLPRMAYRTVIALGITLLLAIGDEYRQSFAGGRTPYAIDVLLDMAGAFTCLFMMRIIQIGLGKRKRKPL